MLNDHLLDQLFRYILATAALSDDYTHRSLGPVHFLKYVYLADLAFAARRDGATFTGANWRFYHFGPWDAAVLERLPNALADTPVIRERLPSQFGTEFERYRLGREDAEEVARRAEVDLPIVITGSLANAIREHGSNTPSLLRHVYLTPPMLVARPGDDLDFRTAVRERDERTHPATTSTGLSKSQQKARAARIEAARQEMARRFARPRVSRPTTPAPRYDEVFAEGTAYLDWLAGEPASPSSGELTFDESIWASDQRREPRCFLTSPSRTLPGAPGGSQTRQVRSNAAG